MHIYSIRGNIPSSHGNLAPASGMEANRLFAAQEKDEVREKENQPFKHESG